MRCEVKLYVAGKVFTEEVIATDYQENLARQLLWHAILMLK